MAYQSAGQQNADPHADLIRRAENLSEEQRAVMDEIRLARQPNYSQPKELLRRYNQKSGTAYWKSPGLFLKAVRECAGVGSWQSHGEMRGYLTKALPTGMNETQGADGGYLVPPEFVQRLFMRTYENDLLSRTTMLPISGNSLKVPAINETSRADGSRFGGVQGYWRSEAGTITATKPSIHQVSLNLDSLTVAVQTTQELLDDASGVALETFIDMVTSQELQFKIGDAIVNGDGETKPQGIRNSPSKIAVAKLPGQAAATINALNIQQMWSRLHVSCRQNAVWLIDQSIEPQLGQMTIGTAGANMVVYTPPGGLSVAPYATLLGKPVLPVEFCQQVGTAGDIILTDLSTVLGATKSGIQAASSMHVYFLTNEMVYRFVTRLDAKSWWINALTPKSGGPTQSNIVELAVRA